MKHEDSYTQFLIKKQVKMMPFKAADKVPIEMSTIKD
jgi:hypothetical protein